MPNSNPPPPNILSYDDLREAAAAFSRRHWPQGTIPVDIEHMVDVGLGVDIVPVDGLYQAVDVGGFLSSDGSAIFVDRAAYEHVKLYHYRFTLAHEIAHRELHGHLLAEAVYETPQDWYAFQDTIPEEDRRWYEWQANSFAGLVLVPPDALSSKVGEAVGLLRGSGVADPDLGEEATRSYLAEWVGRRFEVSADVILRRGKYDGHWSEF